MTMMLDIYLEGFEPKIGQLMRTDDMSLHFSYSIDAIIANTQLSITMPVAQETFGDYITRGFFSNLLQENNSLESVMAKHGIERNDIAGLLYHLGRDCPGAISCVPWGDKPAKMPGDMNVDYDILSEEELGDILMSLRDKRRLPDRGNDPSPLAGVQGKIAVTKLEDGQFALPKPGSGAPTTHIIKIPSKDDAALVDQEAALMKLATQVLPLQVANVEILEIRGCRALLIDRFDRQINGHKIYRIHQEDFCQALSLGPLLKYERNGEKDHKFSANGIAKILSETDVPLTARQHFILLSIFNLVVGNTDNHAKNHSILYRNLDEKPVLAPAYDIVPVLLDNSVTHEFSFNIGNAREIEDLSMDNIAAFISSIGLGRAIRTNKLRKAYFHQLGDLLQNIEDNLEQLEGAALKSCRDMISQNISTIAEIIEAPVKQTTRDAFVAKGGGWGFGS